MHVEPPVIGRMHTLVAQWGETADARAVFLRCYSMMTGNVLAALAEDRFDDPPWVDRLLHRFADYYFDALDAYDADPLAAPAVWRIAHDATRAPRTSAVQHLLLGVNAHINYDLVLTLSEMLTPEWHGLDPDGRERRLADHRRVNAVIAQTVDAVQDQVVEAAEPAWDLVDHGLGRVDEWIASRVITRWRDEVWRNAVHLVEAGDEPAREARRVAVEAGTLARAEVLLLQGGPASLRHLF